MQTGAAIVATLLAVGITQAVAEAQGKIAVSVTPQTRDGFVDVDAGTQDSIKDIIEELRRSKDFTTSPTVQDATLHLVVLGRRVSGSAGAVGVTTPGTTFGGGTVNGIQQPTFTTPGVTTMVPIDRRVIDSILRVGSYERPLASEDLSGGGWRAAAKRVVEDLRAWATANRNALFTR